jgi:hypothetical protein
MTAEERILAASEGVSVHEIASEHGLSEGEVTAVLDREAEAWFEGGHLRRELLLEVSRLSRLEEHYYNKALGDDEGSASAGALFVKLQERKATLLGLNAPSTSTAVIVHQAMPKQETSTERIRAAIDRELRHLIVIPDDLKNRCAAVLDFDSCLTARSALSRKHLGLWL